MNEFRLVDDAVKSVKSSEEYINIGMAMCTEIALDFVENKQGDTKETMDMFQQLMLKFATMEHDVQNLKDAVEEVKNMDVEEGKTLAEMLEKKLSEKTIDENLLLQHEKIKELKEKMLKIISPEDSQAGTNGISTNPDACIEVTQETVNFRCPYTGKEMVNPVRNIHCNHNYEKDGILHYIKHRREPKCPVGGCLNEKPIEVSDLVDNKDLKRQIANKNRS